MELIIITNDGNKITATWDILKDITYFKQIISSGMKETQTNEISFNLNLEQTKIYLEMTSNFNVNLSKMREEWATADESTKYCFDFGVFNKINMLNNRLKTLSFDDLIAIYNQVEYHQNDRLLEPFNHFIENLSYSIELYNWNLQSKILTTNFLADRCINQMSRNEIDKKYNSGLNAKDMRKIEPIVFPPSTDEEFWNEMTLQVTELKVMDDSGKIILSDYKPKLTWRKT